MGDGVALGTAAAAVFVAVFVVVVVVVMGTWEVAAGTVAAAVIVAMVVAVVVAVVLAVDVAVIVAATGTCKVAAGEGRMLRGFPCEESSQLSVLGWPAGVQMCRFCSIRIPYLGSLL